MKYQKCGRVSNHQKTTLLLKYMLLCRNCYSQPVFCYLWNISVLKDGKLRKAFAFLRLSFLTILCIYQSSWKDNLIYNLHYCAHFKANLCFNTACASLTNLPTLWASVALHRAVHWFCLLGTVAKIQEHQVAFCCCCYYYYYSSKLMLCMAMYLIYTDINLCVHVCIGIYLTYIILATLSSNNKSSNAPHKLKQNLFDYLATNKSFDRL